MTLIFVLGLVAGLAWAVIRSRAGGAPGGGAGTGTDSVQGASRRLPGRRGSGGSM